MLQSDLFKPLAMFCTFFSLFLFQVQASNTSLLEDEDFRRPFSYTQNSDDQQSDEKALLSCFAGLTIFSEVGFLIGMGTENVYVMVPFAMGMAVGILSTSLTLACLMRTGNQERQEEINVPLNTTIQKNGA